MKKITHLWLKKIKKSLLIKKKRGLFKKKKKRLFPKSIINVKIKSNMRFVKYYNGKIC